MARPRQHDDEKLLDAALDLLLREGPKGLTISAVCKKARVPSGVVYNRFATRDALVAELWLRTAERFQTAFVDHLDAQGPLAAALFVVRWAREHPREGALLLSHRREDLFESEDAQQRKRSRAMAHALDAAFSRGAARLPFPPDEALERLVFATVRIPEAALRGALARGKPISTRAEELVLEAVRGVLGNAAR